MIQDKLDTSRLKALMAQRQDPASGGDETDRLRSLMGLRPLVDPKNDQRVTIPEAAAHIGGAAVRGFAGIGASALGGIAALTNSDDGWAMNSARWLNESANVGFSEDVAEMGGVTEFATDVSGGLGSFGAQALAFGAGALAAPETGGASLAIPLATTGLLGALGNGGDLYWETKAAGGSDEEAIVAGLVGGGLGLTDAVPIGKLLGKNPALKNKVLRWFLSPTGSKSSERVLHQTLTEGGQEFLQGLGNAATLAQTAGREIDLGDVLRQGGVGAVVGLLTGGGADVARGRGTPGAEAVQESGSKPLEAVPTAAETIERAFDEPAAQPEPVEAHAPVQSVGDPAAPPSALPPIAADVADALSTKPGVGSTVSEPVATEPLQEKADALSDVTPTKPLYRETSIHGVLDIVDPSMSTGYGPFGNEQKLFFADIPELAIGQQGNQGVIVELEGSGLNMKKHVKPASVFSRGNEYSARLRPSSLRDRVKSIVLLPHFQHERPLRIRLLSLFRREGWNEEQLTGGGLRFTRPSVTKPQPAVVVSQMSAVAEKKDEPDLAGIKNAVVDESRAALGLEPATHGETRGWELVNKEAEQRLTENPVAGADLTRSLVESPRTISDTEAVVLLRDRRRMMNERGRLQAVLEEATAKGEDALDITKEIARVNDAIFQNDEAATLAGTKNAQALAVRRAMMKEDYSLAQMELRARVSKGKALTREESAEVQELHRRIEEVQRNLDALSVRVQTDRVKRATTRAAATPRAEHIRSFLKEKADAARSRIRERSKVTHLHSGGVTGQDVAQLVDYSIIGAEKLANGVLDFAEWSTQMLADVGNDVEPHLKSVYERSVDLHAEAGKESGRLKGYKTRTENRIRELTERMERGDVSKPTRQRIELDQPAIALKAELAKATAAYRGMVQRLEYEQRSTGRKIVGNIKEAVNLPKALKSSWDLSAVGRQGGFFSLGHPIETLRFHIPAMLKALGSEKAAQQIDIQLRDTEYRPLADVAARAGLELTSLDGKSNTREEAIASALSDKIPGIRPSNRAFTTFLNVQRSAMFDEMYRAIPGTPTDAEANAIANLVNVGTGRGYVPGKFKTAVNGASTVLWSPRLLLSRMQLLAGQPAYRGTKRTRKLIAKQYARSLTGLAAVYGLAGLAGTFIDDKDEKPDIETDPRSSDFGKIRMGDTRVDPLGGLAQVTVLLSRLATGETKKLSGEVAPIRGEDVPFGQATTAEVIGRFLRGKLSPTIATPLNILEGENLVGEPVTPGTVAADILVPLSFQDIYDAMRAKGVPAGAALGVLSTFGWGVQTYEKN